MAIAERVRSSDGVRTYYIDFRDKDGRVRELAGTTRTQAKKLLARRLGEVRAGTYINPRKVDKSRGPTFDEFADRFMREYGNLCRSDHYKDRTKRLRAFFGDQFMHEITRADLERFVARRHRQVSPSTVRKDLAAIGTMFKKALDWDVIDASPAAGLKKPPEPKHRTRYLSPEEWTRLVSSSPPWLKPMLMIAVATGMRLKEVSKLRWEDIDERAGIIHVATNTKTGTRQIPMNSTAWDVLGSQVRYVRSPYVFVAKTGEHYDSDRRRNRISRCTVQAMRSAGIDDASFHTLRHTAGAWMTQARVPLYEVQMVLGHSTPLMTQRYAHLQPDHLKDAVHSIDRAMYEVDTYLDTRASAQPDVPTPTSANSLKKQ